MKTFTSNFFARGSGTRAFTLAEMMVVVAIFSLLIVALVSCQLFGLRLYHVSETKLAATADGRRALNQIREQVRQAKLVYVGNGDAAGFTNIEDGEPQIGNALQIYATTNLSAYTRYYLDLEDKNLKSVTASDATPRVIAQFVTNQMVFQAEDFNGTVLTIDVNNRVIRMTLEFYQWEYPITTIGQGGMYDYYRIQTRITRRLIE
ncbi:MAG TPA: prepilin-type N-terminal cleavage/methylation domain-containing protein [Verrucomicrobiae bacterium]|nr:prepilin-type N-terminal cleavage/methylation domain-containing protein [Verrucomicrobiae bacterium]